MLDRITIAVDSTLNSLVANKLKQCKEEGEKISKSSLVQKSFKDFVGRDNEEVHGKTQKQLEKELAREGRNVRTPVRLRRQYESFKKDICFILSDEDTKARELRLKDVNRRLKLYLPKLEGMHLKEKNSSVWEVPYKELLLLIECLDNPSQESTTTLRRVCNYSDWLMGQIKYELIRKHMEDKIKPVMELMYPERKFGTT